MSEPDRQILDAAISLIAETGIRGAALRKIGQRAGVHFTNLSKKYGSKDALIAECFAEVVQRDLARFRAMIDHCLHLKLGEDDQQRAALKQEQVVWLGQHAASCTGSDADLCLTGEYAPRLAALHQRTK